MRRIFGTSYQMLKVQCAPEEKVIGQYYNANRLVKYNICSDHDLFDLETQQRMGKLQREGFYAVPIK